MALNRASVCPGTKAITGDRPAKVLQLRCATQLAIGGRMLWLHVADGNGGVFNVVICHNFS